MTDEECAKQRHRERFDGPVDEQRHPDTLRLGTDLAQRCEVDFQQHRDDHHPDQQADRQIHARDFQCRDPASEAGQRLSERDAGPDAQHHPDRQVALEDANGGGRGIHGPQPGGAGRPQSAPAQQFSVR